MEQQQNNAEKILSLLFAIGRTVRQESSAYDITTHQRLSFVQLETLKFIHEHQKSLMKDVAEYLAIAPPSLTPLIDSLVMRHLLERSVSVADRRATCLMLTEDGRETLQTFLKKKMEKMEKIFQKLSGEEQEIFIKILQKLSRGVSIGE
ncbi:MAG: MarR family winged helix-turn-helix transcriptional regulator [Minisyncoccota bacterium]